MDVYHGYSGRILHIDLSTGEILTEKLPLDLARKFVGGTGLGMRKAFDYLKPGTHWSSPENPIIISAGPFIGTPIPGSSKPMATTKLPQVGAVGTGSGSMRFGVMLKNAGYDMAIIRGKARKPVYLEIFDDRVEIRDAEKLWGMDLYETTDQIWKHYGGDCSVAAIGIAGENQVIPSLVLIDKIGSWMRGGGAVWGAKNLKAIAVRGTKGLTIAKRKEFENLVEELIEQSKAYKYRQSWVDWGLMIYWDRWVSIAGGYPVRNSRELYPAQEIDKKYGPKVISDQFEKINVACASCTACDKHILKVKKGELTGFTTYFTTIFGSFVFGLICNVDYPHAITLHDMVQRFGLDNMNVNSMIEWALELYEKGVIDKTITKGLALKPTIECMKTLYTQIARREGFGDILADGWVRAIERIGHDSGSHAIAVKGNTPPIDGRMGFGIEVISGLTNPRMQVARGGSPTLLSSSVPLELFRKWGVKIGMPLEAQEKIFAKESTNIPRAARYAEDWMETLNCLGICGRATVNRLYDISLLTSLYEALTGVQLSEKELLLSGERAINMERAINAREGFSRKDDQIPARWVHEPLEGAGKRLCLQDFSRVKQIDEQEYEKMLSEYFDERGWDIISGNPPKEKLMSLGLEFAL